MTPTVHVRTADRDIPLDAYRKHYDRVAVAWAFVQLHEHGVTLAEIHREVVEVCGRGCQRSTRRALYLLERLGLVDHVDGRMTRRPGRGGEPGLYFCALAGWTPPRGASAP
jgi:hypothetical protein